MVDGAWGNDAAAQAQRLIAVAAMDAAGKSTLTVVASDCNGASELSGTYDFADKSTTTFVDSIWSWTKGDNVLLVHIKATDEIIITLQDSVEVYYQEERTLADLGNWTEDHDSDLSFSGAVAGIGSCSAGTAQIDI